MYFSTSRLFERTITGKLFLIALATFTNLDACSRESALNTRKKRFDMMDIFQTDPFVLETDGQHAAVGKTVPDVIPLRLVAVKNDCSCLFHFKDFAFF